MMVSRVRDYLLRLFPSGTLRARFASGAVWVLAGMLLSQALAALSSIVIARVLGKELFGEYGMVRNTVMMLGALASLGLGVTSNKFTAELRNSDPGRVGRILGLTTTLALISGIAVAVALAAGAEYIAARTLHAGHLAPFIRICAPILAISVLTGVQMGVLSGLEQFRLVSWLTTMMGVIVAIAAAAGAVIAGIRGAFYGTLMGSFANLIVVEAALRAQRRRHSIPLTFAGMWKESNVLHGFAVPSMLAGLMVAPVTWAGMRLLFIRPDGAGETAVFQAANQLKMLALFVPGAIAQVVLPVFANLQGQVQAARYERAVRLAALSSFATGAAVAVPLMILSPFIMGLYGMSFSAGWLVLCFLAAAAVLQATNNVIGESLAALSKMWWGFWLNCLWALEFLVCASLLVRHGAVGLAGAYLISYFLHTVQVWTFVVVAIRRRRLLNAAGVKAPSAPAGEWG